MIPVPASEVLVDPVVARYRTFFAHLDWTVVSERDDRRPWPGTPPHPRTAYVKTLLVKLCEGFPFITQLRAFLLEHPALVRELGFRPVPDPTAAAGFDVARTVPGARWLRHQQQTIDHATLRVLLAGTVHALQAACPELGTTVAVDVKHIYAWVRENNPKEEIPHRFDPSRQPPGDRDCRLGVKRRHNQDGTPRKEYLWGYGTGIASATTPRTGDVVVAEVTQPFNRQDITYFTPVDAQATHHLGHPPTNRTADAAFDAWQIYETCVPTGGIAAIPLNHRGPRPPRTPEGHPICARARVMTPTTIVQHEDGYRAQVYRCPLLRPTCTGATCDHAQFAKGGCRKRINIEVGGQLRVTLDRQSETYRALYRQRTSAERINSQAVALGIERPKVRTAAAVARLNTLIYIVINVHALQRLHARRVATADP